ncbi:MAG: ribonuclease P protein component [Xanthomonadaceae bacterium]|nr:ribonuclease P protein component [Xanthomonadaceae bacterium]
MPRTARLSEKRDFARLFAQGKRSSDRCFTLLGHPNGMEHSRLGLAISRKAARRATARNRLKRLARETFRRHQAALEGLDIVVMAKPGADRLDNLELRASLERHYAQLPSRCALSSNS